MAALVVVMVARVLVSTDARILALVPVIRAAAAVQVPVLGVHRRVIPALPGVRGLYNGKLHILWN